MFSVVKEFSVLYTNRVHQKTKNWKDGSLKYYHFNNRIDVHNEDGNLIASDFFPPARPRDKIEAEVLVAGNEFKLPNNNLLVEVDELTGTYERDITAMFKKRKAEETTPGPRPPPKSAGAGAGTATPTAAGAAAAAADVTIKYESDDRIENIASMSPQVRSIVGQRQRPIGLTKTRWSGPQAATRAAAAANVHPAVGAGKSAGGTARGGGAGNTPKVAERAKVAETAESLRPLAARSASPPAQSSSSSLHHHNLPLHANPQAPTRQGSSVRRRSPSLTESPARKKATHLAPGSSGFTFASSHSDISARIPRNSSSHFQYLSKYFDHEAVAPEAAAAAAAVSPSPARDDYHHSSAAAVKQEPDERTAKGHDENPDILYDLSDLEEDLAFNEMVMNQRESTGAS